MAKKAQKTQEVATETTSAPTTTVVTEVKPIPYTYDELKAEHKTKSGIIRFLASEKYTRGQIAKFMGIKYQFVRNVLITPVKKVS